VKHEYASTFGEIRYDGAAYYVESVPDPVPPEGEGWDLVSTTTTGHVRYSRMAIIWTWRRTTPAPS
jgi:hypothetical protein